MLTMEELEEDYGVHGVALSELLLIMHPMCVWCWCGTYALPLCTSHWRFISLRFGGRPATGVKQGCCVLSGIRARPLCFAGNWPVPFANHAWRPHSSKITATAYEQLSRTRLFSDEGNGGCIVLLSPLCSWAN